MVYTFNSGIQEAEAGRSLSWRPAWSTEQEPELHRKTLSWKIGGKKIRTEREKEERIKKKY